MSLKDLIVSVLPHWAANISDENEIEVLKELPVETLYLALKNADTELALWTFEHALPEQIQGVLDLECWEGSQFLPDRFESVFKLITLVTPSQLARLMKTLDPEIIIRGLMEFFSVQDFNPEEPPEVPESQLIVTPDFKYALILKTESPELKETLLLWLNKFSAANLDLMRRHLETCKWEQVSDLEEFAYQIKKGRIEDMGFVDYHDAIELYAEGSAPDWKTHITENPLEKGLKSNLDIKPMEEGSGGVMNESLLPETISEPLLKNGFLKEAFSQIKDLKLREVVMMELVRVTNMALAADKLLIGTLEDIRKRAERTRSYLELGLFYLSSGKLDAATEALEIHRLQDIYRLGWLGTHDLVKAASQLRMKFTAAFFGVRDELFLESLQSRHLEIPDLVLSDIGLAKGFQLNPESLLKIGAQITNLAALAFYLFEKDPLAINFTNHPLRSGESLYSRLLTQNFRKACAEAESHDALSSDEWTKLAQQFNPALFKKLSEEQIAKVPEICRPLFSDRLKELVDQITITVKNSPKKFPDKRFFKALNL